jgi:hypothetical protein
VTAPELTRTGPEVAIDPPGNETVFTVLAGQVRTRSSAHLWMTAAIGVIDSVALGVAWPGLWWVATGFVAVTAYAAWGLADRGLERALGGNSAAAEANIERRPWLPIALRGAKGLALVVGIAAVLATVAGFLVGALGRAGPPG